jgi:hypothetical protein
MKLTWLVIIIFLLVSFVTAPVFLWKNEVKAANLNGDFYVGVTFGSNSTEDAKRLIDKVSGYVNLFVVDSWDLSGAPNSSALDQVCDYAVKANMSVIVYFDFLFYNVTTNISSNTSSLYNASTWDIYGFTPWHMSWLNGVRERWGDKFLGVYLMDEPGGNQIDRGYFGGNNITFSGRPVSTFRNVSNYTDAANQYVSAINRTRSMQLLTNTSIPSGLTSKMPVFTSDYALYWFDYKAGYDVIFTELGGLRGTNNTVQQLALCRGAAKAQNKDWGAIITWATLQPPYLENGEKMLQDMTAAYNAGAKYVIVFNYPQGALTEEHYNAIKQFWNNSHSSPRNTNVENNGQIAFVLPQNYGCGMRDLNDKIWGFWPADNISGQIWQNMNILIDHYGQKLDIIYDDPKFDPQNSYSQVCFWNSTISITSTSSTNSTRKSYSNAIIVSSFAGALVCIFIFIIVKRRKPRAPKLIFPEIPINAVLKGSGRGTFELAENAIRFYHAKSPYRKNKEDNNETAIADIDNLSREENQIIIISKSKEETFAFKESLTALVYESINKAWINQKKPLEETVFNQQQTELAKTFKVVTNIVDSLFDALVSLHGRIDWDYTESCVKRYQKTAASAKGQTLLEPSPKFERLFSSIKERQVEESSKEIQRTLELLYRNVFGINSENLMLNKFGPRDNAFKGAILAYFTLNDILLGHVVGDEESVRESNELAIILNGLAQTSNTQIDTIAVIESLNKQVENKTQNGFSESRTLLLIQLKEILNPKAVPNLENQIN